jgi:hypothetical protein
MRASRLRNAALVRATKAGAKQISKVQDNEYAQRVGRVITLRSSLGNWQPLELECLETISGYLANEECCPCINLSMETMPEKPFISVKRQPLSELERCPHCVGEHYTPMLPHNDYLVCPSCGHSTRPGFPQYQCVCSCCQVARAS